MPFISEGSLIKTVVRLFVLIGICKVFEQMNVKILEESESQNGQRISVDQVQTFSIWVLLRSLERGVFCLNPALLLLSCQFAQIEAPSRLLEKILQAEIV